MVDREAFYRNVVHSLRNGVIAVWRDGSIAVVNDAAYRILGMDPSSSHISRPFDEVLGRDHDLTDVLSLAFTDTAFRTGQSCVCDRQGRRSVTRCAALPSATVPCPGRRCCSKT
jgi:sensor histidine kinase regulating citrate/malate metabolism